MFLLKFSSEFQLFKQELEPVDLSQAFVVVWRIGARWRDQIVEIVIFQYSVFQNVHSNQRFHTLICDIWENGNFFSVFVLAFKNGKQIQTPVKLKSTYSMIKIPMKPE